MLSSRLARACFIVSLIVASAAITVLPAGAASSAGSPSLRLSTREGQDGTKVQVWGTGFGATEMVAISLHGLRASPRTNNSGSFGPVVIRVPISAAPGAAWVTAVGSITLRSARAHFTVSPNWSQFHSGPNLAGHDTAESTLGPSDASRLQVKWSFPTGSPVYSSPVVADGVLYEASSNGVLYALNAVTGAALWTFGTGTNEDWYAAVANGVVYAAGTYYGALYALNATTGATLWSLPAGTSGGFAPPTVANGVIYVSSGHGVFALNASTGATQWSNTLNGQGAGSSVAVVKGVAYLAGSGGDIYALNATTGTTLWSFPTGTAGGVSSPAVVNGVVYVVGADDSLHALSAATGHQLWSFGIRQPGITSCTDSPAVAGQVVYVGCNDVYALNASTGQELWSFANADDAFPSLAVANGVVYGGSEAGDMFALNANTGAELWSYAPGWGFDASPAVASGILYEGSDGGTIYAFKPSKP